MIVLSKIIKESIAQAISQLMGNKLRSFLSLLGITIGIFCIIGVQAAVDSLEDNIMDSIKQLGSDVVYVSKFNWMEDPHKDFLKLMRRPNPSFADYKVVNKKVRSAEISCFSVFIGLKTAKYHSSSVERVECFGATYEYGEMFDLSFEKGRYFSTSEYFYGAPKCVLGHTVANELFGNIEPIGKTIRVMGRKLQVIGVLEKSGENLIGILDFDDALLLSYELAKKMANLKSNNAFGNATLSVKAAEGISNEALKDDLTGVLRAHRRLRPKEENNFAMNEISLMQQLFSSIFGVLNVIGLIIGIFAILVGVFSVANIMFVSVKERTNIIGIKKALGAKRYIILLEFLIEAIILCLIGGLIGLLLVYGITTLISSMDSVGFKIYLSSTNVISGIIWSTCIGVISGLIPAMQASGMDPVEAIRAK